MLCVHSFKTQYTYISSHQSPQSMAVAPLFATSLSPAFSTAAAAAALPSTINHDHHHRVDLSSTPVFGLGGISPDSRPPKPQPAILASGKFHEMMIFPQVFLVFFFSKDNEMKRRRKTKKKQQKVDDSLDGG